MTADVLARWESVLDRLGRDPMLCADELDWVAKLRLLEGYREREELGWASPKLQLVDLQYSDVRPEKGLYHRLVARGSMQRLLTEEEVARGDDRAAGGHPGLLPRPVPGQYAGRGGRGQLGLGDLRRGPRVAGPGADDGAASGAPRRTSARCSTAARAPRTCWRRSSARPVTPARRTPCRSRLRSTRCER